MKDVPVYRVLVVDDNPAIHEDFRKVLASQGPSAELKAAEALLLGAPDGPADNAAVVPIYELDFASQGEDAVDKVTESVESGRRFSLAFVDMRMPPGLNGMETIWRLWEIDPDIQAVICTAYSDYSWRQILGRLGYSDRLLILKKPFDPAEACQLACAMTRKWSLSRQADQRTAELEQAVRERTLYLQRINDELQRNNHPLHQFCELEVERNHLRDSVRAMEQVLGIIGHELRTPLGCIRGLSEMMLKTLGAADDEAANMLGGINTTAREMAQTLDSLLEAARLNSGQATWNWSSFSLNTVCDQAILNIRPIITGSAVGLVQAVDPPDVTMSGDPDGVRRLLVNLLINACKHTTAGQISLSVAKRCDGGVNWIELKVDDTGSGIPPEFVGRLGEPFALNRGVVGEQCVQGAGLGIAICKSIAHAHGGFVDIQSAVGVGTNVTVRLRQDLTKPVPARHAEAAAPASAARQTQGRNRR